MPLPSDQEVDAYIANVAQRLGINPTVAIQISRAERGPRSRGWIGDERSSFGPFQLHLGGLASGGNAGPGLGDVFRQKTGLDPRDIERTWRQQIDFSLQWARDVSGWEPFKAARNLGYGIWDGIRTLGQNAVSGLRYFFPLAGYTATPKATYHTPGATDLFAPKGTPVRAIAEGRVATTSSSGPGGYSVLIKGLDGLDYYYAHFDEPAKVKPGDYVAGGQQIGVVGNSGNAVSTDPHVHIGIGYGISSGVGPSGGAGVNFDAQSFLANILNLGGAAQSTEGVVTGTLTEISRFDIGGQIRRGITEAFGAGLQGIQNYVTDRAASIAMLTFGLLLILMGVWGFVTQTDTGRRIVQVGARTVGGPVGTAASIAA